MFDDAHFETIAFLPTLRSSICDPIVKSYPHTHNSVIQDGTFTNSIVAIEAAPWGKAARDIGQDRPK